MSYTKLTDYSVKDSLPSGDTDKIIRGTEIDAEFDAIETDSALKATIASPTFTGTVTIPSGQTFDSLNLTGVPTAPTPVTNIDTTQVANTAWVNDFYAPIISPTFTGTPSGPTATVGTATTQFATTAFVATASFNLSVSAVTHVSGTSATGTAGAALSLENVSLTAVTANASPIDNEEFAVIANNGLLTNTVDFGAKTVRGPFGSLNIITLDTPYVWMRFKFSTSLNLWMIIV